MCVQLCSVCTAQKHLTERTDGAIIQSVLHSPSPQDSLFPEKKPLSWLPECPFEVASSRGPEHAAELFREMGSLGVSTQHLPQNPTASTGYPNPIGLV